MKSTDSASKITARHLARKAVVYLRQSSIAQVRTHVESTRLQYALKDTAKAYGFAKVEVIDVDLGMSASSGAQAREGFKQLLASVALGEVGIVLSREPSRLSRTDKDWCHLMELCRVLDTLIGDVENIYDLCQHLMDNGVTINRPPRDGYMAFVRSPDNVSIELLQEGEKLAPAEPWASMPNTGHW